MFRPLSTLKIPERARTKLQSSGYMFVEDIEQALSEPAHSATLKALLDDYKIADRLDFVNGSSKVLSAVDLWHSESCYPPVAVFHPGLDKLLGGGLPLGKITELCGAPGCGKTQICLQFCVDVQIPSELGGSGAQALYISTDFGFDVGRLQEIIQGSIEHCSTVKLPDRQNIKSHFESPTEESLLDGISVIRVYDATDLCQAVRNLGDFLQSNSNIRLLIIDSFNLPFVVEIRDLVMRSKIISSLLEMVLEYAVRYKMAVVLTNQLVTIVTKNSEALLKPSLGEGFAHRVHQRLVLDEGKVYLTKSIDRPQMFTHFKVTKEGIR